MDHQLIEEEHPDDVIQDMFSNGNYLNFDRLNFNSQSDEEYEQDIELELEEEPEEDEHSDSINEERALIEEEEEQEKTKEFVSFAKYLFPSSLKSILYYTNLKDPQLIKIKNNFLDQIELNMQDKDVHEDFKRIFGLHKIKDFPKHSLDEP